MASHSGNEVSQQSLSRNNHYLSQGLMRRWSSDGDRVWAYGLLAPDDRMPPWTQKAIKGLAFRRDLYTVYQSGGEVDDFERWVATEIEDPALSVIDKIQTNRALTRKDWDQLALFAAAQDLRTPATFMEFMKRWDTSLPDVIQETLEKAVAVLEEAKAGGVPISDLRPPPSHPGATEFRELFRVRVDEIEGDDSNSLLGVEMAAGRKLWVQTMRHLLSRTAKVLTQQKWRIAEPFGSMEWPLPDHATIRLNFYGPGQYDFKGGWGKPGSEILMPLTPRHLLYAQVGKHGPRRFTLTKEQTLLLQRMLVERAHRWVIATKRDSAIQQMRPRFVSREESLHEAQQWENWHAEQVRAEKEYSNAAVLYATRA